MATLSIFAKTYPYLMGCFFSIPLFILCCLFFPTQRRPMLFSALLFTPFALVAVALVPVYWKPKLFWDLMVGIEDVVFCFITGGTVWLLSVFFVQHRLVLPEKIRPSTKRYIRNIFYGFVACSIFFLAGLGYLWSILASLYTMGFILLINQRDLWPVALWGAATFLGIYFFLLKTMFFSWPHFLHQWNLPALSGLFLGLPLEELVWALGFGFTWPLFMSYVFDIQVRRDPLLLDKNRQN